MVLTLGQNGAAAAASGVSAGTGTISVTGEKKKAQEEAKTPHGADPGGFGSVGLWRRHEGGTGQAQPRDVEGIEPQHLANDIEGKAAWVSREARWLNELEADIAKLQAHLIQKRRDLQVEIQEVDVLRAQLAKNTGCVGAGNQGNEPLMQELEKRELLILRELVAANVPSNLEALGLEGSERSRKWNELREIQESIANKKQRVASPENGL